MPLKMVTSFYLDLMREKDKAHVSVTYFPFFKVHGLNIYLLTIKHQ